MLNTRYPYGNQKLLEGEIPWNTAPVVALLVGTQSYTYSSVHRHLADIPTAARVAMSGTLEGRTSTLGIADANNTTFEAVPMGPVGNAVILLTDTGDETTSVLIAYLSDAVGLPVNPDGSDILITWSDGANKIFAL